MGIRTSVRNLVERHRARHTPTGFGFALADRIDYLPGDAWDGLVRGRSVFLGRPYLRVIENAGPDNVRPRFAMVWNGGVPVAAVAAQAVLISGDRLPRGRTAKKLLSGWEEQVMVCGNLLSWGSHGVAFRDGEDPAALWPAVTEALYRLRRADRLFGDSDFVLIKDLTAPHLDSAPDALRRFSYREIETEPNMVIPLAPEWRTFDDYLGAMKGDYRRQLKKYEKDVTAAGLRVETLSSEEVVTHGARLHALYMNVHERAGMRLITISPDFMPGLATTFGDHFRCTVARRDDEIVGFVTTLKDEEGAVGYYVGLDYSVNEEVPLYFRLLQAAVADAIALRARWISLGRTAMAPKARLGAQPQLIRSFVRHRVQAMNLVVRALLRTVPEPEEMPERSPFKEQKEQK